LKLDHDGVLKIAHLARLEINEQEVDSYAETLSRILGLIEQMNAVDTDKVQPMAHPQDTGLRFREDEIKESDEHEKFQRLAPKTEAGLYLVPKVLE